MSFISKFFSFIKGLISKVSPEVKSVVEIGIKLVENIKKYSDSGVVDVLTAIIPGDVDDKIVATIRLYLPKLLASLQGLEEALDDESMKEYIEQINSLEEDAKAILTHGIASAVNRAISDDLGSMGQAFITTEVVFKSESKEVKSL